MVVTHGATAPGPDRITLGYWAAAFLMGRAAAVPLFLPFGPAFLLALSATPPRRQTAAFLGAACGYATLGDFRLWAVCLGGLFLANLAARKLNGRLASTRWVVLGGVGGAISFLQAIGVGFSGSRAFSSAPAPGYLLAVAGAEAALGFGATVAFTLGIRAVDVFGADHRGPVMWPQGARVDKPGVRGTPSRAESLLGAVALAAAAIAGLRGLAVATLGIDLQSVAARGLVLASSCAGGAVGGAASGFLAGLLTGVGGFQVAERVAALGVSGLVAGTFGRAGTAAASAGFLGAAAVSGLLFVSPVEFGAVMRESVLAAALFLSLVYLGLGVSPLAYRRLRETAATREVPCDGRASPAPGGRDPAPEVLARGDGEVPGLEGFAALLAELAASVPPSEAEVEHAGEGDEHLATLIRCAAGFTCGGCASFAQCWGHGFFLTYKKVSNLLARAWAPCGMPRAGERAVLDELKASEMAWCKQPEVLRALLGGFLAAYYIHKYWGRKARDLRRAAGAQIRGLAAAAAELSRISTSQRSASSRRGFRPKLRYEVGVAEHPAKGEITGDRYLAREFGGGTLALMLADGMGTGAAAAREGEAVLSLMQKVLSWGLPLGDGGRLVNSLLSLRPAVDAFTALDVVTVDLETGISQFLKVGTPPTFLKRGKEVSIISGSSAPMGIVEDFQAPVVSKEILPGDVLVMVTDGVLGPPKAWGKDSEERVCQVLRGGPAATSAEEAERILKEARAHKNVVRTDDMTVMVTFFT